MLGLQFTPTRSDHIWSFHATFFSRNFLKIFNDPLRSALTKIPDEVLNEPLPTRVPL